MKNLTITPYYLVLLLIITITFSRCKEFLDAKPDQTLAVPSSVKDLRAILDNTVALNTTYPSATEILADNYYISNSSWGTISDIYRAHYSWTKNEDTSSDWGNSYVAVRMANVVLENLPKIKFDFSQSEEMAQIKGAALFFRGFRFYTTAQLFADQYRSNTASNTPGIPLKLNTNFKELSVRSTLEDTYERILSDLKTSALLLPSISPMKTRPCRAASYGMIAKVYISMQKYDSAGVYADKCLDLYDKLLDFNIDIDASSPIPFLRFNDEVIFHTTSALPSIISATHAKIDPILYQSYANNDLRKIAYFKANTGANLGSFSFKGDYNGSGNGYVFGGVATDEMHLIRAECNARAGKTLKAMEDLNKLLITRFAPSFVPFTVTNAEEALALILIERRKELLYRGTRWIDLRRLKDESGFSTTPKRIINDITFELLPNSPRYTMQIPFLVINRSGMTQNP